MTEITIQQNNLDRLLTEGETANYLNISKSKLQKDRVKGVGVPFVLIGTCVRYKMGDIMAYIAKNTCNSSSQVAVGA